MAHTQYKLCLSQHTAQWQLSPILKYYYSNSIVLLCVQPVLGYDSVSLSMYHHHSLPCDLECRWRSAVRDHCEVIDFQFLPLRASDDHCLWCDHSHTAIVVVWSDLEAEFNFASISKKISICTVFYGWFPLLNELPQTLYMSFQLRAWKRCDRLNSLTQMIMSNVTKLHVPDDSN